MATKVTFGNKHLGMSTDCDSSVLQTLNQVASSQSILKDNSPLAPRTSNIHPSQEISYEGRVSLISPLRPTYDSNMSAVGLERTRSSIGNHHNMENSVNSQMLNRPNPLSPSSSSFEAINAFYSNPGRFMFPNYGETPSLFPSVFNQPSSLLPEKEVHSIDTNSEKKSDTVIKQEIHSQEEHYDQMDTSNYNESNALSPRNGCINNPPDTPPSNGAPSSSPNHVGEESPEFLRDAEYPETTPDKNDDGKCINEYGKLMNTPEDQYNEAGSASTTPIRVKSPDENDPLMQLQFSIDKNNQMNVNENNDDVNKTFRCEICNCLTQSHAQLTAHIESCHTDMKCPNCGLNTKSSNELYMHLQSAHDLCDEEAKEIEGVHIPRINAQGKIKTYKCKQCTMVSYTKIHFWEHSKEHIKKDKQLPCQKCPFVTEYKHHLDYHMRNHLRSKPFKCDKCSYSCVNKSMLNSHKKSHSNIYQYRCSDCNYATKYCHSLKLHLRKYQHNPAMVLNPDGTPNPIPVIDVYGTRRGPKLRKDDNGNPIMPAHFQMQAQIMKVQMDATGTIPPALTIEDSKKMHQLAKATGASTSAGTSQYMSLIPEISSPILSRALVKGDDEAQNDNRDFENQEYDNIDRDKLREIIERTRLAQNQQHQQQASHLTGFLHCSFCEYKTFSSELFSQHMQYHIQMNAIKEENSRASTSALKPENSERQSPPQNNILNPLLNQTIHNFQENMSYLARFNPYLNIYNSQFPAIYHLRQTMAQNSELLNEDVLKSEPSAHDSMNQDDIRPNSPIHMREQQFATENNDQSNSMLQNAPGNSSGDSYAALDLSKEQTPPQTVPSPSISSAPYHSTPNISSPRSESSTPPVKSRRKGRAFKIDRIALKLSESAEGEGNTSHDDEVSNEEKEDTVQLSTAGGENKDDSPLPMDVETNVDNENENIKDWRTCHYCKIAFKDSIMFTMHMGVHGTPTNPFTCNTCGLKCNNKLDFFCHIFSTSH